MNEYCAFSPLDGATSYTLGLQSSAFPMTADVSSAARQCVCFYCVAAVLFVDLRPCVLAWKKATVACRRSLRALLCVTCCQTDSRAARKIDGQPAVTRAPRLFFSLCVHVHVFCGTELPSEFPGQRQSASVVTFRGHRTRVPR